MKSSFMSMLGSGLVLLPLVAAGDVCQDKTFYVDQCTWLQRSRPFTDHFGYDDQTSMCDSRTTGGDMFPGSKPNKVYPYGEECTLFYDADWNDVGVDAGVGHMDCPQVTNIRCNKAPSEIFSKYCGFLGLKPYECTHRVYCKWQECKPVQTGWCGVHVTQYQKNEGPGDNIENYRFSVTLKDADGNVVGGQDLVSIPSGETSSFTSALPWTFDLTAPDVDGDAVWMAYAGQHFTSNDQEHHCNFGAYDGGKREGDCGFTCN